MSGLPGMRRPLPAGACCDRHADRRAVANVQGETDSFGFETVLMCEECLAEDRAYERSDEARSGRCDWCKADAADLRWARDYDEGLSGPTYRICGSCHDRQQAKLNEELDRYGDDWEDPSWDYPDDDAPTPTPGGLAEGER